MEVKSVWLYHFGPRLISGKEFGKEDEESENETLKMIQLDTNINRMVKDLYKKWCDLEKTSRRPDRSTRPAFLLKQEQFVAELDMLLNICCKDARQVIQDSGFKD